VKEEKIKTEKTAIKGDIITEYRIENSREIRL